MRPRLTGTMDKESSPYEQVTNYYEALVYAGLNVFSDEFDDELIADVACIALNQLPCWYIRHSVYAHHYIPEEKHAEMQKLAYQAIDYALAKLGISPS